MHWGIFSKCSGLMSAKTARNRTGSGKLMVKLKGKIVTKILNRKGNNKVTEYRGRWWPSRSLINVPPHHRDSECPDADKSFLIYAEIVRCQHGPETSGNKQWWGDQGGPERRQQISHQSTGATSGSNIDIVTARDCWHTIRLLSNLIRTREFRAGGRGDKIS